MLTIRLSPEIEKRLRALAKKSGRTKSYLAREAIVRNIEDFEDYELARQRLDRGVKSIPLEELESEIDTTR
jgi:RHH-type transcriptional regulator, rel operon repressor / antitoxin RelB